MKSMETENRISETGYVQLLDKLRLTLPQIALFFKFCSSHLRSNVSNNVVWAKLECWICQNFVKYPSFYFGARSCLGQYVKTNFLKDFRKIRIQVYQPII